MQASVVDHCATQLKHNEARVSLNRPTHVVLDEFEQPGWAKATTHLKTTKTVDQSKWYAT